MTGNSRRSPVLEFARCHVTLGLKGMWLPISPQSQLGQLYCVQPNPRYPVCRVLRVTLRERVDYADW